MRAEHGKLMRAVGHLEGVVTSFRAGVEEAKEERAVMRDSLVAIRDSLVTMREQHIAMDAAFREQAAAVNARISKVEATVTSHARTFAQQSNWLLGFGAAVTLIFGLAWSVLGATLKAWLGLK